MPGVSKASSINTTTGPPAWLFSNNSIASSNPAATKTSTMAKKDKKVTKKVSAPAAVATSDVPSAQLMDLVENFLSDQGFANAHREFKKHRADKGWKSAADKKKKQKKEHHSLVSVFQTWETFSSNDSGSVIVKEEVTKVSSSESDSSSDSDSDSDSSEDVDMADAPAAKDDSDSSSSSSSSSSSDSDSDSESEDDAVAASTVTGPTNLRKRKAESDSDSSSSSSSDSDSDSDSDSSSSEDQKPKAKKAKTAASRPSASDSSSSSDSDSDSESSEDEAPTKTTKAKKASVAQESSESDSDSSSSDSDSSSDSEAEVAAKVALPESDSDSSSSSDSESDSDDVETKKGAKTTNGAGSDTSATLDKTPSVESAPLPPDPTTFKQNNRGKATGKRPQNEPFSRIKKDVYVDPGLSSNEYINDGYGQKAHEDLIVTRGKGFTKEKNKKKRGAYRGGPLDINRSMSFKFDD